MRRPVRSFGNDPMTVKQGTTAAITQIVTMGAMNPDGLLRLTIEDLMRSHRADRRLVEARLLACQDKVRRERQA